MLYMEYSTKESAEGDAHAFLNLITVAIPTETFTAYTGVTLTEEAIAVDSSPSNHLSSPYITTRSLITSAFDTIPPPIELTMNIYLSASPQRPLPRMDQLKPS